MRFDFQAALILALLVSGCSKSVSKTAGSFAQLEPEPTSTPTSTPTLPPTPIPTSGPVGCEPGRLGDLTSYAIYTREDLKLSNVTVGNRVAAADADISKAVLGYRLTSDKARTDLATVYELDLRSTKVAKGNATYGKSFHSKKSSAHGGILQAPFSMADGLQKIGEFSNACARAPQTATLTRTCAGLKPKPRVCTLHIKGANAALNVAEIAPENLAGVSFISIEVPLGSTLVANMPDVRSQTFKATAVVVSKKKTRPTVYWNFPTAEHLTFSKTFFYGTVVAPDAEVTVSTQAGDASFWSRKLSGSGAAWW